MNWYLVGLILFTYLANHIALKYGFTNLHYRMEINKKFFEINEEIQVTSVLENKKPFTVTFLKVTENFPKSFLPKSNKYALFIMPYQRVRRTYKISGGKRGLYPVEDVHLSLGDLIGFHSENRRVKTDREIIILPERLELAESIVPIGAQVGDISVKRWIIDDPLMTIGIREYTGNEPERYIHWPSSIKYDNLMVKNFDFTTDNSVIVMLNLETFKPSWESVEVDLVERVISLTRGVMEEFEGFGIPYGFASNIFDEAHENRGYFFPQGLGQNHLDFFLEILGKIDYQIPSFFENTLQNVRKRQGNFTTAVIITPRILPSYIEPINLLSRTVSRTVIITLEEQHLDQLNNNIIKYRSR